MAREAKRPMNPMEHLRSVARSRGASQRVASEAAWALSDLVYWVEPQGLVPACRRLVEWHPAAGALWNLAVRVLAATDPAGEARLVSQELAADTTAEEVAELLPDGARVVIIGGELWRQVRRARPDLREARAGRRPDIVLVEAEALGRDGFVAREGAAAACATGAPVWVVAPAGAVVGGAVWDRIVARMGRDSAGYDLVDRAGVAKVIGPAGHETWAMALTRAAPEAPPPTLR
jgi:hypothetical protein